MQYDRNTLSTHKSVGSEQTSISLLPVSFTPLVDRVLRVTMVNAHTITEICVHYEWMSTIKQLTNQLK